MNKHTKLKNIAQLLIAILGAVTIVYYSKWQILIGVLLLIWANNIDYLKKDKR